MISLIARRYQEEQEDLEWGSYQNDDNDNDDNNDDEYFEDDSTPSACPLQRSASSNITHQYERPRENQLVATFLTASGTLQTKISSLCRLLETSIVDVNAMTTQDKPHTEATRVRQLTAENTVISNIFMNLPGIGSAIKVAGL